MVRKRGRQIRKKYRQSSRVKSTISKLKSRIENQNGRGKKGRQVGGAIPWLVDFKKGGEIVSDLIKDGFKGPKDVKAAKKKVKGYRAEYESSGSTDSYSDWAVNKGYAEKSKCVIL